MITLGKEKAVYSVLLPEVKKVLESSLGECYLHTADKEVLDEKRNAVVKKFKKWVSDIVDLSEFNYAYPMHGVTGSIEQWLLDHPGNIFTYPGEYGWLKIQRPWIGNSNLPFDTAYISNPFSATGNFHQMHETLNLPTFLDCAFVGTTEKNQIKLNPNIKVIAFSLSKGFCLNLFRTGFLFSREKIDALEVWLSYNYFNSVNLEVTKKIIDNFPIDYVYNKFQQTQKEICLENNLSPSDCVFLATTDNKNFDHYKRADGTNRICLSREYAKRGLGTFSFINN